MKNLLFFLLIGLFIFVTGCSEEEPMEEEIIPFSYEGKWLGRWSDSLFPSISVSAIINSSGGNKYTGSMYVRAGTNTAYTPGYGGLNDGTIRFETDGANNVISFTYLQNAPDYKGGCPGTYEGDGAIDESINRLVINFTGTDCDGFHDNGKFIWESDN